MATITTIAARKVNSVAGKMIAPFWTDLRTDGGHGVFISTSYSDEFGNGVYIR